MLAGTCNRTLADSGTKQNAKVKSTYTDGVLQPKSLMQRKKPTKGALTPRVAPRLPGHCFRAASMCFLK
jgi:hypothetical protein